MSVIVTFTTRCHELKVFRLNSEHFREKKKKKKGLGEKPDGDFVQESDEASRRDQLERDAGKNPAEKTKTTWKMAVACQDRHPVSSLRTG